MRDLVFGPPPRPGEVAGARIELPIDWSELRGISWFVAIAWPILSIYALVPSVSRWLGRSTPLANRWSVFLFLSIGALSLLAMVVRRYRRAAGVVFTTAGIWMPTWRGGKFVPWEQVGEVTLKNFGKGRTDIELRHPEGRLRIYATAFADPYAVSRLVRAHVGEGVASTLPTEGEI